MIRLATLGEIELRRADGAAVSSILRRPMRFALLCYLAVADSAVRRDTLLGLFWPERPEGKARHGLSQAILTLRQGLGDGVIEGSGAAGYGIAPGALWCDVADFRATLARGDRAEAVRLYHGDFLPGFAPSVSLEFEQWLELFRGQLRRQAAEAAWELAQAEASVNPVSAAGIGRRAVELSLGDEAAVRRLIELLHRIGDRGGAFEAYEGLRRRLAADYAAEPSAETIRLVALLRATTPADRAAAIAARAVDGAAGSPAAGPPAPPVWASRRAAATRRPPLPTAASAALTTLLIAGFVSLWGLSHGRADDVPPSVIVEDVRDYSRTARHNLAGAVTTEVLAKLTGIASMRVHAPDAVVPTAGSDPHHLLLRAGLTQSADSVRVTAVLLDGRSRVALDRGFIVRPTSNAIAVVDDVAGWLSEFARRGVGGWVRERNWRERAPRGRALELIRTAVRTRHEADSLRWVAGPQAALAAYRTADELLARAEKAAPEWSEPTVQRAETALRVMFLRMVGSPPDQAGIRAALGAALEHAARGIEKGDPAALETRAVAQHWLWLTAPPDSYPAVAALVPGIEQDLKRTLERDATRARAWYTLSMLHQVRGEFGEAGVAAERARAADAFLEYGSNIAAALFSASLETRHRSAARTWCDEIRKLNDGRPVSAFCELMILATFGTGGLADVERGWAALRALPVEVRAAPPWAARHELLMGVLLARAGARDSAVAMLQRGARSKDTECGQFLAWGLLELGHADSAAAVLERTVSPRLPSRIGILKSERFRALREHPRIAALLRTSQVTVE